MSITTWINASLYKYFQDALQSDRLYFEGSNRTPDYFTESEYIELRILDFNILNSVQAQQIDFTLNILIQTKISNNELFNHQRITDQIVELMKGSIQIFKFVDGDQSLIDCLSQLSNISVDYFGQVKPEIKTVHSTVEADYRLIIKG